MYDPVARVGEFFLRFTQTPQTGEDQTIQAASPFGEDATPEHPDHQGFCDITSFGSNTNGSQSFLLNNVGGRRFKTEKYPDRRD